jgi:hypothetical protein
MPKNRHLVASIGHLATFGQGAAISKSTPPAPLQLVRLPALASVHFHNWRLACFP